MWRKSTPHVAPGWSWSSPVTSATAAAVDNSGQLGAIHGRLPYRADLGRADLGNVALDTLSVGDFGVP
jgi:hypothetical protein